jgi:hypothetical protein
MEPCGLILKYVEGKRVRVAIVIEPKSEPSPMGFGYLNRIISGGVSTKNSSFESDTATPAYLQIDSTDANIKIYGIRIYSKALKNIEILNNYTASLEELEDRENKFNSNNIYDDDNNDIDYNDIIKSDYDLQIPYMTITGGWSCEKESKWQLK